MAEGARLESVFTRKGNVGSNPTLSAITFVIYDLQRGDTKLIRKSIREDHHEPGLNVVIDEGKWSIECMIANVGRGRARIVESNLTFAPKLGIGDSPKGIISCVSSI